MYFIRNSLCTWECLETICWGKGIGKGKGKTIPEQDWTGPEGSRRLRIPDLKTVGTWRWLGCRAYAPADWYSFLLKAASTTGPIERLGELCQWKISIYSMGNRNGDLPACIAVPQPTAPPSRRLKRMTKSKRVVGEWRNLFTNMIHNLWSCGVQSFSSGYGPVTGNT